MSYCECGCGELAPIARVTRTDKGHVRGEPVRFISGHNARGLKRSPETRAKIAQGKKRGKHPRWQGDDASEDAIHIWLNRNYPRQHVCARCESAGWTHYAFLRHPEPYTRNRNDYLELCGGCHARMDRGVTTA